MAEQSKRTQIEIEQKPSSREYVLTRRGRVARAVGGTLLAAGVIGHGVTAHPENPVGGLVHDVIQVGVKVVDAIPGVEPAEMNAPTPEQAEKLN